MMKNAPLRKGVVLKDGLVRDVALQFVSGQTSARLVLFGMRITVHEGRNRLVRKAF